MLKNYFKIGWRNLLEGRSYSLINVSGLAIGMAVTTLIGLWIFDELNRNRNFQNYDRIAKVYHHLSFDASIYSHDGVPAPMGNELKSNYPDFENVAVTTNTAEHVLAFGETKLSASGMFVDPDFFGIFSVQLSHGTTGIRNNLRSVVLSKTLAANLVGDNAVGKIVKLDNKDELIIAGTFEDFPANCQFGEVKMLMPFDLYFTLNDPNGKQKNSWENYDFQCFVLMRPDITVADADSKIINIGFDKGGGAIKAIKPKGFLFPMGKWHLYTEFKDGKNVGGKIQFLWMFGMVGAFVLVLACINFMNLSTGRSEKRSKEVGIRKVMGSTRPQLIGQFLSESALVVIVAFFASIIIVIACIPWFNQLANKQMNVPWTNSYFLMITFGFIFLTSVLAGSYPALYLSAFNPIRVLKGNFRASRFAAMPRKILVVFQFTISTALVIGTIVVFQQIQHAKDRPVGFDRDGIIFINVRTADLANTNYNTLRSELIRTGVVANMAKSDFPITGGASADPTLTWQGKDPSFRPLVAFNSCSHDFPATNGFQIVEGRDFSRDFASDSTAVLINETAARLISEDKSPLGKKITFGNGNEGEIIGVIKDQVRNSPFSTQWPHIYHIRYRQMGCLTIRLAAGTDTHSALEKIESVLKKYDPGAPFDYKFLDDDYARLFHEEERVGKLAGIFTALAIFISCLGIFGLASFTTGMRNKEIGIRKVLGASIFNIWKMLSGDFVRLVIVSLIIAAPVSYYFSNQWLQKYEYRTGIAWWIFAATALGSLGITFLTVSYQCIKAAIADPVNSLRSE